jgi:hypothetical protein
MTASLKSAFVKASRLPRAVQDELAEQLLADIEGEVKWEQMLKNSQGLLERMARKAREDKRRGRTVKKGFDEL